MRLNFWISHTKEMWDKRKNECQEMQSFLHTLIVDFVIAHIAALLIFWRIWLEIISFTACLISCCTWEVFADVKTTFKSSLTSMYMTVVSTDVVEWMTMLYCCDWFNFLDRLIALSWIIEVESSSRLVKTWFKSEFLTWVFELNQDVRLEYSSWIKELKSSIDLKFSTRLVKTWSR